MILNWDYDKDILLINGLCLTFWFFREWGRIPDFSFYKLIKIVNSIFDTLERLECRHGSNSYFVTLDANSAHLN